MHADESGGLFGVTANVIKGGNRLLKVVARLASFDVNNQVSYEGDAVLYFQIPRGEDIPDFRCMNIKSCVVEVQWE